MPEIHDDDFFQNYEAAVIIYETSYENTLDIVTDFGGVWPHLNPEQWALIGPTAIGRGFRWGRRLHWIYPVGLAIQIDGFECHDFSTPEAVVNAVMWLCMMHVRWEKNRH